MQRPHALPLTSRKEAEFLGSLLLLLQREGGEQGARRGSRQTCTRKVCISLGEPSRCLESNANISECTRRDVFSHFIYTKGG